jgi:putative tryptophan/tyrosine transport system substrate-binding protein
LIGLDVGVLIVVGAATVKAALQVTTTTPIVAIDLETDPVHAGYAASVARPGSNVTGLFMDMSSLAGKWVELLQEIMPTIERVAVVWDPTTGRDQLDIVKAAAHAKGIEALVIEARSADDYEETFRSLGQQKRTGLMQLTAPGSSAAIAAFSMVAQKYDLPTSRIRRPMPRLGHF